MDTSLLVSIVIAIIAIVPGIWALVNQSKKDRLQNALDMNKAAQEAVMAIITPLRQELERLQSRIGELEKALIDKTIEIGKLRQEGIDKDSKIRQLECELEEMELRLQAFESKKKIKNVSNNLESKNRMERDNLDDIAKKEEIENNVLKSIEKITNGSTEISKFIKLEE